MIFLTENGFGRTCRRRRPSYLGTGRASWKILGGTLRSNEPQRRLRLRMVEEQWWRGRGKKMRQRQ